MATKKLIALGGPRNLDWLPDYDQNDLLVAEPTDLKVLAGSFRKGGMVSPIVDTVNSARYVKELLGDPETGRVKNVYRYEKTTMQEADNILKNWLMAAFINMEE